MTLSELVDRLDGAKLKGEDREFNGVNEPGRSDGSELEIWLEGPVSTGAPALVDSELDVEKCPAYVMVDDLFAQLPAVLSEFQPAETTPDVSPHAVLADDFETPESLYVGPFTTIGPSVTVGENVVIRDSVTIRGNVTIDDDVTIKSGVRIESPAEIGPRTTIHSNTVIGADGYGYREIDGEHHKLPQVGGVVIGENVEIGAEVTIDRAMYGETVIGTGTKIDNHVHIGHNVKIGKHCLLVSMTGISGSAELGDHVTMAGQSGVKDHVTIADDVTVGGRGGVTKDIEEEGTVVSGYPARPHREALKQKALVRKLPAMKKQLGKLSDQLEDVSEEITQS